MNQDRVKKPEFSNLIVLGQDLLVSSTFEMSRYSKSSEIIDLLKEKKIKVLILNEYKITLDEINLLSEIYNQYNLNTEILAIFEPDSTTETQKIYKTVVSRLNPIRFFFKNAYIAQEIEETLLKAIRRYDYHQQNNNFYLLFEEQGEKLKELNLELQNRVNLKNISLTRSQNRLKIIQAQLNLLYECILGIQNSKTIGDIEDFLTQKLTQKLKLKWIRILVTQKEIYNETLIIEAQKKYKIFGTPLTFNKKEIGHVYFAKLETHFRKKDESLLLQISEIISIKINQIMNYSELLLTRSQWQQTFKSIKHKIAVVDKNFNLINTNFDQNQEQIHQPCHKVIFNKSKPCSGCTLGQTFEVENLNQWHKVNSQKVNFFENNDDVYINFYQNVTEQKSIEKKIIEKTKLSELGILAGSLAHELNNPLGGIITFLQLILSDPRTLQKESLDDIQDLLNAALDCKDVIQSILESVRTNKNLDL